MNERVPLAWLVPLRILCGLILVLEGWGKLQGGWLHGTPLLVTLDGWATAHKGYHFFEPIMNAVRAHPKIFGTLVTMGELAVGVSLTLGLFTRLGAFLGVLMMDAFAAGAGQGLAPPGTAIMMGAILLTFVAVPPGRVLGFDQALRARLPRWMV